MAAPAGNNFNPKGRPKKPINWTLFEQLCEIQCTQDEMEGFLHVNGDTLSIRVREYYGEDYQTVYKRFAAPGKCNLRRSQMKLAQRNASMSIWLGKQYLGQKDNIIESPVTAETNAKFDAIMNQIDSLQSQANPSSFQ